jgi:hypothetical protein
MQVASPYKVIRINLAFQKAKSSTPTVDIDARD